MFKSNLLRHLQINSIHLALDMNLTLLGFLLRACIAFRLIQITQVFQPADAQRINRLHCKIGVHCLGNFKGLLIFIVGG